MDRRKFLKSVGGTALGTLLLTPNKSFSQKARPQHEWTMITAWPKMLTNLWNTSNFMARSLERISEGRIRIKVIPAHEIMHPFEILDAVSEGKIAQIGNSTPFCWNKKHEAFSFFSSVPFGLNAQEMLTWMQFGKGQELMDELYGQYNLKPFPAGNSGVQMGGWYNKQINTIDDFKGLKMRMPGFGGEVLKRLGSEIINRPPSMIIDALNEGLIEAAEYSCPFDDRNLKLYKAGKFYYWPGWQEPSSMNDFFVNKKIYDSLTKDLQEMIKVVTLAGYSHLWSAYSISNGNSLLKLVNENKVVLKKFSDRILQKLARVSDEVVREISAKDTFSKKIFESYYTFKKPIIAWNQIGEEAASLARSLTQSFL